MKYEFLQNLRTAAKFLSPDVSVTSPSQDATKLGGQLKRAAIWLTPSAVKGFRAKDFAGLPDADRQALQESVERFTQVAKQVPPAGPATAEQIRQALPAFERMLEILRPSLELDEKTRRVQGALRRLEERAEKGDQDLAGVVSFDFGIGHDEDGDPLVWVWAIFEDPVAAALDFYPKTETVRRAVQDELRRSRIEDWAIVSVRTVSEQRDLPNL
jgi:hypothetical protein